VQTLGYQLDDAALQKIFDDFIALADKKKDIYDADLIALIENRSHQASAIWSLVSFQIFAGTGTNPTATIELQHATEGTFKDAATGDGPVDAAFKCLERMVGISATLLEYNVRSISGGKDAQGEVTLEIGVEDRTCHGKGVSTDVMEASVHAYLQALNKALSVDRGRGPRWEKGI
jgi:2-isopropylmalate synthase